ncbi:MAG: hypoxanthine phosphoribosyltransferase [Granulosicoccus sp.]|nr:hypoxanthine phosphoribosyltransferase [Granulosicoccus sp.]
MRHRHPSVQSKRYVTETDLLHDAYRLGVKIAESGFRPTFIVGLWRGGSVVGIAVQECLQYIGIPTDHIAIRTSYRGLASYQQMVDNPETEIRIHGTQYLLDTLDRDDALLIVDDVFSSGLTSSAVIRRLTARLKNNMPADVRIAVPWYKPAHNRTTLKPDYYVNTTDDWLVMPYELSGLTHEEISRNKPWLLPILASLDQVDAT